MTFNEYLNKDNENNEEIFEYYLNFLNELSSKEFPYELQLKLKGAAGKFFNCIEKISYITKEQREKYFKFIDALSKDLKMYRRAKNRSIITYFIFKNSHSYLLRIQDTFEDIYSLTLDLINEVSRINGYSDNLKLNGFYQPENSNKKKIKELINEAIELVNEDDSLTEKSKKQIIDYLNRALMDLERENVNWPRFVGRIKETIIVLGALDSLAGGLTPLVQAKDKLEETTVVIQKTSINLNYNILNETFNFNSIRQIGPLNTAIMQIEETSNLENDKE